MRTGSQRPNLHARPPAVRSREPDRRLKPERNLRAVAEHVVDVLLGRGGLAPPAEVPRPRHRVGKVSHGRGVPQRQVVVAVLGVRPDDLDPPPLVGAGAWGGDAPHAVVAGFVPPGGDRDRVTAAQLERPQGAVRAFTDGG